MNNMFEEPMPDIDQVPAVMMQAEQFFIATRGLECRIFESA